MWGIEVLTHLKKLRYLFSMLNPLLTSKVLLSLEFDTEDMLFIVIDDNLLLYIVMILDMLVITRIMIMPELGVYRYAHIVMCLQLYVYYSVMCLKF